jgi:hypothetical protein
MNAKENVDKPMQSKSKIHSGYAQTEGRHTDKKINRSTKAPIVELLISFPKMSFYTQWRLKQSFQGINPFLKSNHDSRHRGDRKKQR